MAMKMRQSLAQLEREFEHEMELELHRDREIRQAALRRTRKRTIEKRKKRSSMRFWMLVLSILATAVIVTFAMFETLYRLLG